MVTITVITLIAILPFLLFDSEWVDEDSWQKWEEAFPEEIQQFKYPVFIMMCSLTFEEPYYDCNRVWLVIVVYGQLDNVLCRDNTAGCTYYWHRLIFMENGTNIDNCDRNTLHLELLHLKYMDMNSEVVHQTEPCVLW